MFCKECGNMVSENTKFCSKCGSLIDRSDEEGYSNVGRQTNTYEKKEVRISRSTIILVVVLVVVVIGFVVVWMNMSASNKEKDSLINDYQQKQEDYNNRSSGEKAVDGFEDIIDAIDDMME